MTTSPLAWVWGDDDLSAAHPAGPQDEAPADLLAQTASVATGDTGKAVPGPAENLPAPNLESEVRRVAEQQIRQAALDQGVLKLAETNAGVTLRNFLRGVGFKEVDVH